MLGVRAHRSHDQPSCLGQGLPEEGNLKPGWVPSAPGIAADPAFPKSGGLSQVQEAPADSGPQQQQSLT